MSGIFDPPDQQERNDRRDIARANDKRPLPKRFYKAVDHAADGDTFVIRLDGKPVRTPARHHLGVTSKAIADALIAEWAAQGHEIDPATMPLTRLVNSAIDGVADKQDEVRAEILRYAGSDLLCYRADKPERLVSWQARLWNPPLDWMKSRFHARFLLAEGVIFVEQFPETIAAVDAAIGAIDPLRLAALNTVTVLTGSTVLALAVLHGEMTAADAWAAAHVDEDFEAEVWGADAEASARRAARWQEMQAAALVLAAG